MDQQGEAYVPAPWVMRTYRAEDRAMFYQPAEPLDGTLTAAQAYVDRITRSAWWRRTCPPSWLGDESQHGMRSTAPPRRVLCVATRGHGAWATTTAVYPHRGRYFPRIRLGAKIDSLRSAFSRPGWQHAPIAEPWVILHELAHIMAACAGVESGHDRTFRYYHLALVRRWLSPAHAEALRSAYKIERLTYLRPPHLTG